MNEPVTSMSKARLTETLRDSATAGVEQNRPTSMPETAKRAVSAAIARSQAATSWQPAAVAMPCTRAITGTGSAWIACMMALQRVKSAWKYSRSRCARISCRSCPAQKALPAPAMTTQRKLASAPSAASSRCKASSIASDSALSCRGRFRRSVTTPASCSRIRISSAAGAYCCMAVPVVMSMISVRRIHHAVSGGARKPGARVARDSQGGRCQ